MASGVHGYNSDSRLSSDRLAFGKDTKTTLSGERTVFLINGGGTTGCPHAKESVWTLTLHNIKKLTQNGSKTYREDLK